MMLICIISRPTCTVICHACPTLAGWNGEGEKKAKAALIFYRREPEGAFVKAPQTKAEEDEDLGLICSRRGII